MAKRPDVRYINYYVSGAAAPNLVPQPVHKKKPRLPKPQLRESQELQLRLDPVAIVAVAVAAVMLVLMFVGVSRLYRQQAQVAVSAEYLQQLQTKNLQLKDSYANGYDLEEVEKLAVALGMVPKDTLVQQQIQVTMPVSEQLPTGWENFCSFVRELFA